MIISKLKGQTAHAAARDAQAGGVTAEAVSRVIRDEFEFDPPQRACERIAAALTARLGDAQGRQHEYEEAKEGPDGRGAHVLLPADLRAPPGDGDVGAFVRDLDALFRAAPGPFHVPTQETLLTLARRHFPAPRTRVVVPGGYASEECAEHIQGAYNTGYNAALAAVRAANPAAEFVTNAEQLHGDNPKEIQ